MKAHQHDGEARPAASTPGSGAQPDGQTPLVPAAHPHDDQTGQTPPANGSPTVPDVLSKPKIMRQLPPEKQDPAVKYRNIDKQEKSEWGVGEEGYKPPKNPSDKMRYAQHPIYTSHDLTVLYNRKNLPYKVMPFYTSFITNKRMLTPGSYAV
jgi:hypothetical protein